MKNLFLSVLLLTCLSVTAFAADFMDVPWGASSTDVISIMGTTKNVAIESGRLHFEYDISFNNNNYSAFFILKNNRLNEKLLCLKKPLLMNEMVLEEFEDLQQLLTQNYGRPADMVDNDERFIWKFNDTIVDMELNNSTKGNSLTLVYLPN